MEELSNIDFQVFKLIHFNLKNEYFDVLLPYVRDKFTWIPLYIYSIYLLWKKYGLESIKIIILAVILVVGSDFICAKILKVFFERLRPCHVFENEMWFSQFKLCSQTFSFPSCHAMNHSVLALYLFYIFNKKFYRIFLVFWLLIIVFSQIYIGVHFPFDIIGGLFFGSIIGILGIYILNKILEAK